MNKTCAYLIYLPTAFSTGQVLLWPALDFDSVRRSPQCERQHPSAREGMSAPPATSIHPGVPDTLLAELKGASIVDEHRALMGAVIEKIQSAESGLNEACISLIRGFEVCFMRFRRVS